MGFKDWISEQAAQGAREAERRQSAKRLKAETKPQVSFEGIDVATSTVAFAGVTYPLAGTHAVVEIGGTQSRTTATRVVVGSVITLGVGTAIGAMAKKKTNNIYLSVELADGQVIIVEAKPKQEGEARKFAAALNSAAARAS